MRQNQIYQINKGLSWPVFRRRPWHNAWVRRHKLVAWLIADLVLLYGFYLMTQYIWVLTTPLVKLFKIVT